ncbi:IclR family transcriptional regulator [Pseudoroseomonas ludipueritiae]|uniref:IclR family transcriptional regulator n=1 Tax=Pseudoroseomonas ludipueritiae TaxID=198093 RepID=A0ABR7R2A0_9PROT|nr:IclR family transcriptional regulator [Pseudoroseomonas ludipueritiae]MBC9175851.1 IclR family transcriptional regulator [Pseudoroseomonas ludipueritiae]
MAGKGNRDSKADHPESSAAGASVVSRVADILRAFAEGGESASIKDLSHQLALAPSTLHRLLDQLVTAGLIERSAGRRYRISNEFSRIGALVARRAGVLRLARPVVQDVARETTETCMLGMLLPQTLTMMFVEKAPASAPVPYQIRMHHSRSLLWGATGLCLLAWLGQEAMERVLRRGDLSPLDGRTPPGSRELAERLAQIRAQGYALTCGEQTREAVGIAAPVFGANRRIVGDLCITLPRARFSDADESRLAGLLMRRAAALSRLNGHIPSPAHGGRE